MSWWNPASWDWGTVAKDIAVAPLAGAFATGAALNTLTGGSGSWSIWDVVNGKSTPTYSRVTQALSGYQGGKPGDGRWGLPIVNPSTPKVVGAVTNEVLKDVLGIDTKTLLLIAAGVGAVVLATK